MPLLSSWKKIPGSNHYDTLDNKFVFFGELENRDNTIMKIECFDLTQMSNTIDAIEPIIIHELNDTYCDVIVGGENINIFSERDDKIYIFSDDELLTLNIVNNNDKYDYNDGHYFLDDGLLLCNNSSCS